MKHLVSVSVKGLNLCCAAALTGSTGAVGPRGSRAIPPSQKTHNGKSVSAGTDQLPTTLLQQYMQTIAVLQRPTAAEEAFAQLVAATDGDARLQAVQWLNTLCSSAQVSSEPQALHPSMATFQHSHVSSWNALQWLVLQMHWAL